MTTAMVASVLTAMEQAVQEAQAKLDAAIQARNEQLNRENRAAKMMDTAEEKKVERNEIALMRDKMVALVAQMVQMSLDTRKEKKLVEEANHSVSDLTKQISNLEGEAKLLLAGKEVAHVVRVAKKAEVIDNVLYMDHGFSGKARVAA